MPWTFLWALLPVPWAFQPKDSSHCLQWIADGPHSDIRAEGSHPRGSTRHLCRFQPVEDTQSLTASSDLCPAAATQCVSQIGNRSTHVNLGTLAHVTRAEQNPEYACVPVALGAAAHLHFGESPASQFQVLHAKIHPSCDVWWREVSADVIPPIPELALSFGTTPYGDKLGLCRTFGDDVNIDGGDKIVGTLVQEGPDFGRCFFTLFDGTPSSLDGGNFHILQARAAEPSCVEDDSLQKNLSTSLALRLNAFLNSDDEKLVANITGFSFAALREELLELGSCDLKQVMSAARFVPHPLNTQGLHVLRSALAERMGYARAEARGFHQDHDYVEWQRDGILIRDLDEIGEQGLHRLLQIVSGEATLSVPEPPYEWVQRNVSITDVHDPQHDIHMDTFAAIVKVWVFEQDVTLNEGPLMFARGSHRNSVERLRWMYAYSIPPAKEALTEPSLRLLGSDNAISAAPFFVRSVLQSLEPVLPLQGVRSTLVIADTSGLHRRGSGFVGHVRKSWRLKGDTDGGLKRLDPFRLPHDFGTISSSTNLH